jgi:signal transduction histidine kinase
MDETFILIAGTGSLVLMAIALLTFTVLYQKKIRNKEHENQQLMDLINTAELEYLSKTELEVETERKKISEDIHHHLGGKLAQLRQSWSRFQANKEIEEPSSEKLITDLIDQIVLETKKVSNALYMISRIGNLEVMIKGMSQDITLITGLEFQYQLINVLELNVKTRRDVFRMVQEMVSNTLKYAKATTINLDISMLPNNELSVLYYDDGSGFDTEKIKTGMGFISLKNTCLAYSGTFEVESSKSGTTIALLLKL